MTNGEILLKEMKNAGLDPQTTILNTYAGWKRNGYQVIAGNKAVIKTMIWKPVKDKEASAKTGENETKLILVKAALFTFEQVEKAEQKAS